MGRIYEHCDIDRTETWLIVDGERVAQVTSMNVSIQFEKACRENPNAEVSVREEQHVVEWTTTHYREA